jgi:hypothetical protein
MAVILTQKIGRRSLLELLPQHLVGFGLMGVMWWVTVGL